MYLFKWLNNTFFSPLFFRQQPPWALNYFSHELAEFFSPLIFHMASLCCMSVNHSLTCIVWWWRNGKLQCICPWRVKNKEPKWRERKCKMNSHDMQFAVFTHPSTLSSWNYWIKTWKKRRGAEKGRVRVRVHVPSPLTRRLFVISCSVIRFHRCIMYAHEKCTTVCIVLNFHNTPDRHSHTIAILAAHHRRLSGCEAAPRHSSNWTKR